MYTISALWTMAADGFGVRATRATTVEELATQFSAAIAEAGPHLIDAVLAR
jgi:acetolactate synthase-1/2/3 large subunit